MFDNNNNTFSINKIDMCVNASRVTSYYFVHNISPTFDLLSS